MIKSCLQLFSESLNLYIYIISSLFNLFAAVALHHLSIILLVHVIAIN